MESQDAHESWDQLKRELERQDEHLPDVRSKILFQLTALIDRLGSLSMLLLPDTADSDSTSAKHRKLNLTVGEFRKSGFFEVIPVRVSIARRYMSERRVLSSRAHEALWDEAARLLDDLYRRCEASADISEAVHLLYLAYVCILRDLAPDDPLCHLPDVVKSWVGTLGHPPRCLSGDALNPSEILALLDEVRLKLNRP